MKNYVLLVDAEKCTQCYNCVLACKDEHFESDFSPISTGCKELGQNWIDIKIAEHGDNDHISVSCWPEACRHCAEPECVAADKGAYKREDGIVILDPEKARDESILDACPYNAIVWNDEKGVAQKCTMCAHLLDAGEKEPRCVEACPTSCLTFGDANDPESEVSKLIAGNPQLQEQGKAVRYFNLPGRFIAGSVYLSETEVAEGAKVRLLQDGKLLKETTTNGFGDFKFKDLPDNTPFSLEIAYTGRNTVVMETDTTGNIVFEEVLV